MNNQLRRANTALAQTALDRAHEYAPGYYLPGYHATTDPHRHSVHIRYIDDSPGQRNLRCAAAALRVRRWLVLHLDAHLHAYAPGHPANPRNHPSRRKVTVLWRAATSPDFTIAYQTGNPSHPLSNRPQLYDSLIRQRQALPISHDPTGRPLTLRLTHLGLAHLLNRDPVQLCDIAVECGTRNYTDVVDIYNQLNRLLRERDLVSEHVDALVNP